MFEPRYTEARERKLAYNARHVATALQALSEVMPATDALRDYLCGLLEKGSILTPSETFGLGATDAESLEKVMTEGLHRQSEIFAGIRDTSNGMVALCVEVGLAFGELARLAEELREVEANRVRTMLEHKQLFDALQLNARN